MSKCEFYETKPRIHKYIVARAFVMWNLKRFSPSLARDYYYSKGIFYENYEHNKTFFYLGIWLSR